MENHLKAWRANRALSWLYAIALLGLGAYVYFDKQAAVALLFAPATGLLGLCVFHAFVARGARMRRPWARVASLVAGFVLLLAFPIGTIIGLYLIAATWAPWPEAYAHSRLPSGAWPSDAVRDRARVNSRR